MTPLGWIFMLASVAFVWGLAGYCFYRVLTTPAPSVDEEPRDSEPA